MAMRHACRICRQSDSEDDLIVPCRCRGTLATVHKTCLMEWRKRSGHFFQCEVCQMPYQLNSCRWIYRLMADICRQGASLLDFTILVLLASMVSDAVRWLVPIMDVDNGFWERRLWDVVSITSCAYFAQFLTRCFSDYQAIQSVIYVLISDVVARIVVFGLDCLMDVWPQLLLPFFLGSFLYGWHLLSNQSGFLMFCTDKKLHRWIASAALNLFD